MQPGPAGPVGPPMALLPLLASPRRRELLRLTWHEERSAGDLHRAMPDVTWGAVSLHLGALVAAGLVAGRADGRRRFYRARPDALGPAAPWLEAMWQDALWRLKLLAELDETRRGPRRRARARRRSPSTRSRP